MLKGRNVEGVRAGHSSFGNSGFFRYSGFVIRHSGAGRPPCRPLGAALPPAPVLTVARFREFFLANPAELPRVLKSTMWQVKI